MFLISSGVVEPLPAALVRPDTTYKYEWVVPKGGGPTEKDPDCITYLYYSAVDPIRDTNSGLVGPFLICKPKTLKSGKQVGEMDAEWAKICKMCWDESTAWFVAESRGRDVEYFVIWVPTILCNNSLLTALPIFIFYSRKTWRKSFTFLQLCLMRIWAGIWMTTSTDVWTSPNL